MSFKHPTETRIIGWCFLLALAAACVNDHRVRIHPELYIRPGDVGGGTLVKVEVSDRRPRNAIFEKKTGPEIPLGGGAFNKISIYPGTPVDDPIEAEIKKALVNLGFNPVRGNRKFQRLLQVEVLRLQMLTRIEDPQLKIPEKDVRLRIAFGVTAQSPDQTFKRLYQTHLDKSQNLLTGEFKNEQFINNGISLTLQKIFEDQALLRFLSGGA